MSDPDETADASSPLPRRLPERALLLTTLLVGAALRLALAFTEHGIYWPDEIYQSFEPAHRLVFGYGLIAWEFIDGARNWALPGLVAFLMKGAALVGLDAPAEYLAFTRASFALAGAATAYGAYLLARALGASQLGACCAAALFALAAPALYFAPRAMSENASALPVVLGLAFALRVKATRREVLLGASLLGLATLLRLQNGLWCVGLLTVLLARKDWLRLREAFLALVVWAALFGALDWATWGRPFHSALVYLQFNLVEGKASLWGTSPAPYYVETLWTSARGPLLWLVVLGALGARRAPGALAMALGFFVFHSLVPHKELRFILPALPVFAAVAGAGFDELVRLTRWPRWLPALGVFLACGLSAAGHRSLTFGELGQYLQQKPQASAYDDAGPINRLLLAAHAQPSLCGLKIEPQHLAWTGGHTYLHREVPLWGHNGPPRQSGAYDHVITLQRAAMGLEVVASEGPWILGRLPIGTCRTVDYSWRLP